MISIEEFAAANNVSIIAPAGYGKTHLIVDCLNKSSTGKKLVLTHTHAGIGVLRRRLREADVSANRYQLETIAGWCLWLAGSFPQTTSVRTSRPSSEEWPIVYAGAEKLLLVDAIKEVIRVSYDGVYVDEYQDCMLDQHRVILNLSKIIPVRILGDPLQAIFTFGAGQTVVWERDVKPHFTPVPGLTQPRRWDKSNPDLGRWLVNARIALENNEPIDIRHAPSRFIKYTELPSEKKKQFPLQRELCSKFSCRNGETFLALASWEPQCHGLAKACGARFRSPETVECDELFSFARALDNTSNGLEFAAQTVAFAEKCLTRVNADLGQVGSRLLQGGHLQAGRTYARQEQFNAISEVTREPTVRSARKLLVSLASMPKTNKTRDELFNEMLRSMTEFQNGRYSSLAEAAERVRDITRRTGRSPGSFVVSRTLLMKGLEFDHVMIMDAGAMDRNNLYVALSRAKRSIHIISRSPVLSPYSD